MKKGDIIIIIAIAVLAIGGWAMTHLVSNSTQALSVVVKSEGKVLNQLQIDATTSASYTVENKYGSNVIWIREGSVEMHEASCKNQLCVNVGHISLPGQSIVCLPNRVVIEIKGENTDGVDAISQ